MFLSTHRRMGGVQRWLLHVLGAEMVLAAAALGVASALPHTHQHLTRVRPESPYAPLHGDRRFAWRQAWTDRGRPILVRYCANLPDPDEDLFEAEDAWLQDRGLDGIAVRTGNPGPYSNCFGWTFTGGRFALDEGIEDILEDNDYRLVSRPRAGDLAVYQAGGTIAHVGIVRECSNSVGVVVESKWGARARYHHPAESYPLPTPYRCVFYRSPRWGHQLKGLE